MTKSIGAGESIGVAWVKPSIIHMDYFIETVMGYHWYRLGAEVRCARLPMT